MNEKEALREYLRSRENDLDAQRVLPGNRLKSPGYHTTIPDGTWVHQTRESLIYAYHLLASGMPKYRQRALKVIRRILSLQDTDITAKTYGIWPWLVEEPLKKMSPPDWNWADFIGAALLMILCDHRKRLPPPLRAEMRQSIIHAAYSIFRRNVRSDYTNIAIMGAGVTLAAGELFSLPDLFAYGKKRLADLLAHTEHHGSFNEYNSPTYTIVAVEELNRIRHLVTDASVRSLVKKLHRHAWTMIAEHWHPSTMQWAGPHSRAYADVLQPETLDLLRASRAIDYTPPLLPPRIVPCFPAPKDIRPRFRSLPKKNFSIRRRFIRNDDDARSVYGTTWFSQDAVLGSSNHDFCWAQRRPIIAYWKDGGTAVLRLRFLRNGRDFSSGRICAVQHDNRIACIAGVFRNNGDFHPSLDKPADNVFKTTDLRICIELTASNPSASRIGDVLSLSAGTHTAFIHTAGGIFFGCTPTWELNGDNAVDCVLYTGAAKDIEFSAGEYAVPIGIEVSTHHAPAGGFTAAYQNGRCRAVFGDIAAETDTRPY